MSNISFNLHPPHGIVNKLLKWEVIYRIAKINNLGIMLNWAELDYIDLPNTTKGDILQTPGKMGVFYSKEIEPEFKLEDKDWICACGPNYTSYFNEINAQNRPLALLKFKGMDSLIRMISKDNYVGIHVRRGDFEKTNEELVLIKGKFNRTPNWWFRANIKRILDKKLDTKFYLATNGTYDEVRDIFSTSGNIIDSSYYCDCKNENQKKIIDLCALSYCKFVLGSYESTFSKFPYLCRSVPVVIPGDENQDLGKYLEL